MLIGEPGDAGVSLKILDFGVARAAGSGDTGSTSLGTRGYMAPEQITAPDAAQPAADLYSLSVMFYELLVGVLPQGHWQPPSGGRSDVPPAIGKLIERGLANNPRVRPQSVAEYGKALAEAMNAVQTGATFAPWLDKLQTTDFKPPTGQQPQAVKPQGPGPQTSPQPSGHFGGKGGGQLWRLIVAGFTRNYANGKGRASRMEYWSILIAVMILAVIGYSIDYESLSAGVASGAIYVSNPYASGEAIVSELMSSGQWFPAGTVLALAVGLAPAIAVTSRRLHDMGYSGWLALVTLIPSIGQIASIIIGIPAGKPEANAYGPNPLGVAA